MPNSTISTIIVLLGVGVLIFVVPLVTLTDRSDNVTQENVKLIVEEFVTDLTNTGKLTRTKYQNFQNELDSSYQNLLNRLVATGNMYDVEIEIYRLDENPGKKTSQTNYTKIGENVYYSEFTTQILNQIGIKTNAGNPNTTNDTIILNEGDIIYVRVKNTNSTAAQTLKSSFLGFSNVVVSLFVFGFVGSVKLNSSLSSFFIIINYKL